MMRFGSLTKALAIVGVTVGLSGLPAFAGEAETTLLMEYVGDWRGAGQMTGARTDNVTCRLAMTEARGAKINYSGRCSFAGAQLAVRGTVAYVDANNRYEAVMTSTPGNFSGVSFGKRTGDRIKFDLKNRNVDEGSTYDINSSMVLEGGKINVAFKVTFVDSGESINAEIPFERKS